MARIRVLEIGKSTAGIGVYLRSLACGLDQERFRPTFICLSEGGPELAAELAQIPGIQAVSLAMNRYRIDLLGDLRLLWRLARLVRRLRPDLIHAHGSKAGFLARVAALGSGIPVVYSPHCFAFHAGVGRVQASLLAGIERWTARFLTAKIITVSDAEQQLARRYRVGRPDQFVTIRTGMDLESPMEPGTRETVRAGLGIGAGQPLVGAVGRLSRQKDPLTFVQMAGRVHVQRPEVRFVWVGSGPLLSEARELAARLDLQDCLQFLGERSDVKTLLKAFDCFVLCSRWEALSIVLLEAMAAGLPVVATDIPGNTGLVLSGFSGYLVSAGNAAALADAVLKVVDHPLQARALARSAQEHIRQHYTLPKMMDAIQQVYTEIHHGAGGRLAVRTEY